MFLVVHTLVELGNYIGYVLFLWKSDLSYPTGAGFEPLARLILAFTFTGEWFAVLLGSQR